MTARRTTLLALAPVSLATTLPDSFDTAVGVRSRRSGTVCSAVQPPARHRPAHRRRTRSPTPATPSRRVRILPSVDVVAVASTTNAALTLGTVELLGYS